YNAAISAFGAGGRWELSLQHCRELLATPDQVSCGAVMDAAAKGGRWDWTLTVLSSMGRWRLAPDIFNYNIAISEASHWQQSLQLQGCRESGRAPNGITYSNSLTTLAAHGCWKFALCMSRRMRTDRCHSEIACGAALNACEKGLQWRASLMMLRWMAQQGMETNEICYRAAMGPAGPAKLRNETPLNDMSPAIPWLGQGDQRIGEPRPAASLKGADSKNCLLFPSGEVACGTPSAGGSLDSSGWSCELCQLIRQRTLRLGGGASILEDQLQRLSLQEPRNPRRFADVERRLPLRALATLCWSFASAPLRSQTSLCEVFYALQRELASRVTVLRGREAISSSTDMLEVLWASSFVGCLQLRSLPAVWKALQHVARSLDSVAHLPSSSSSASTGRLDPLAPEMQVDESGDASGLPLSRYVQKLCNMPIHYDESHQRGFLHRLDVPSSGMILVASTFSAYYDLQFQLSAGMLTRDYAVQSHGWCSDRGTIRASVAWADTGSKKDSPSRVTAGENSQTHLKVLLHSIHMGRALSFMAIRIGTGRKHQIRVHTAHVGHATVSDGLYSTAETYSGDQDWCQRIFLHRYHLAFRSQALRGEEFEARDALPPDLQDCLQVAQVVRPCSQRAARSARFASLPPWHLCSQLTRKRRETRDQQQLVLRSSMRCLFRRQPARTSACHCQPGPCLVLTQAHATIGPCVCSGRL
ncbi:rluD, partial [Symbiodinium necroappetens]